MNGSEVELQHFEEESMKQSTATLMRSELNEEGVNEIMCTAENGKGKTTKTFKVHLSLFVCKFENVHSYFLVD